MSLSAVRSQDGELIIALGPGTALFVEEDRELKKWALCLQCAGQGFWRMGEYDTERGAKEALRHLERWMQGGGRGVYSLDRAPKGVDEMTYGELMAFLRERFEHHDDVEWTADEVVTEALLTMHGKRWNNVITDDEVHIGWRPGSQGLVVTLAASKGVEITLVFVLAKVRTGQAAIEVATAVTRAVYAMPDSDNERVRGA